MASRAGVLQSEFDGDVEVSCPNPLSSVRRTRKKKQYGRSVNERLRMATLDYSSSLNRPFELEASCRRERSGSLQPKSLRRLSLILILVSRTPKPKTQVDTTSRILETE